MKVPPHKVQQLEDDGLLTPEVRDYAEDKYSLVKLYCHLFTTSMRNRWDELVYLDLFSSAGRARIRGTKKILPGSPVLALDLEHPFDRYVFCEADAERIEVLRRRVERDFPNREVAYVAGDVNEAIDAVLSTLPVGSRDHRVLAFCFVDPYSLQNLKFSTIRHLSERYMDFLVLVPTGFDATRNWMQRYVNPRDRTVEEFLGNPDWRQEWEEEKITKSPDVFLMDAFGASMERLGYHYPGIGDTQTIRLTEKNVLLYRLALFSRHKIGMKFWREVKKYAPDQRSLF